MWGLYNKIRDLDYGRLAYNYDMCFAKKTIKCICNKQKDRGIIWFLKKQNIAHKRLAMMRIA